MFHNLLRNGVLWSIYSPLWTLDTHIQQGGLIQYISTDYICYTKEMWIGPT